MKGLMKRGVVLIAVLAMVLSLSAVVMATIPPPPGERCPAGMGQGLGFRLGGFGLMWAEDGTFLDREAFEARLDALIAEGLISEADRAAFLERYDWCAANGGGAAGERCNSESRGGRRSNASGSGNPNGNGAGQRGSRRAG